MSGKYPSEDTLLLRLMMRAIDQSELTHEINNASASIAANLTYIGLQSRNQLSNLEDLESTKETFVEFDEICQESSEAIQRVTKSLGQPNTETTDELSFVELGQTVSRLVGCFNNYIPAHEVQAKRVTCTVKILYRTLIHSMIKVILSCINARVASDSPEKKRIDVEILSLGDLGCKIVVNHHLQPSQSNLIHTCVENLQPTLSDSNFEIALVESEDVETVDFLFKP